MGDLIYYKREGNLLYTKVRVTTDSSVVIFNVSGSESDVIPILEGYGIKSIIVIEENI